MCDCKLKNELEVTEDILTSLIRSDEKYISIVGEAGIYQVDKRNDEFMRFLYNERKKVMTQNLNFGEKQWKML